MFSATFWIRALQLMLALSFLVVIHELGHFTFARIFGVRVEKFYMFFNPWFSLLRAKKINGKWQVRFFAPNVPSEPLTEMQLQQLPDDDWRRFPETTEWGIGWLPFGGYCAIAGMVDETKGVDDLADKVQPWEYRSKPTWQRLPIILGGVLVNFIAALVIYSAILFHWGEEYIPLENARYGMQFSQVMLDNGFQNGDRILYIGDRQPDVPSDVVEWLLMDGERQVSVLRGDDTVSIELPEKFAQIVLAANPKGLMQMRFPFVINSLIDESPAARALLMAGDSITAINGVQTTSFFDVQAELAKHACDSITLTYYRAGEEMTTRAYIGDEAKLGVYPKTTTDFLQTRKVEYGFFESIPAGIKYGWDTLAGYVKQFKLVFTKEGAKQLGGFGAIGSLFPPMWDWHSFWLMTAFLSIILAFMNIIPIPGLDGGYVFFLLWEMITGKKPGEKFLERVNNIGFWLLLLLMLYANLNDILKLFM